MNRPLQRILNKGKTKVNATPQTSELLMLMADHKHQLLAQIIQTWLHDPAHSKQTNTQQHKK